MAVAHSVLEGNHTVLTPEYVEFDFVLAGLYSRFLAWLLDTVIVIVASALAAIALSMATAVFQGFGTALIFIVYFLIDWGYAIALETGWSGQTIGKRALGLRVVQESGVRINFYHAVLRNLARLFDRLPLLYLVGGLAALFSESQQRFGDMLAGTIVVRERRLKIPSSISRPEAEAFLSEYKARVNRLTAAEQEVLFAAAIRREELGMEARLALFAALSKRLEDELQVAKPPHLSDEKHVLIVAAAAAAQKAAAAGRKPKARAPALPRAG